MVNVAPDGHGRAPDPSRWPEVRRTILVTSIFPGVILVGMTFVVVSPEGLIPTLIFVVGPLLLLALPALIWRRLANLAVLHREVRFHLGDDFIAITGRPHYAQRVAREDIKRVHWGVLGLVVRAHNNASLVIPRQLEGFETFRQRFVAWGLLSQNFGDRLKRGASRVLGYGGVAVLVAFLLSDYPPFVWVAGPALLLFGGFRIRTAFNNPGWTRADEVVGVTTGICIALAGVAKLVLLLAL